LFFCHADEGSIFYDLQVGYLSLLEDPSLSLRMTKEGFALRIGADTGPEPNACAV